MILDSLALDNVGLYSGHNELALNPVSREKSVVLIGGLNGAGKTTLLEAVQLALYGAESPAAPRGAAAYRGYLAELIHRGADPHEGAAVRVNFRRFVAGIQEKLSVTRSWRFSDRGLIEHVGVVRDGEPDPLLSEHWAETMESYLPARLARLFFFDGEQIKEMAEEEHAAEILSTAITSLLGLDIVDDLVSDLQTLERRKRTESLRGQARHAADALQEELDRAVGDAEAIMQRCAVLQNEIDRAMKDLESERTAFHKKGGEIFMKLSDLTAERASMVSEIKEHERSMRDLEEGPAPLLLVLEQLQAVEEQAVAEIRDRQAQAIRLAEEERDRLIARDIKKVGLDARARKSVMELLDIHRTALPKEPVARIFEADPALLDHVRQLRTRELPRVKRQIEELSARLDSARERLARLDRSISTAPTPEAIAPILKRMEQSSSRIERLESELKINKEEHRLKARVVEQLEAKRRRFLEDSVDEMAAAEDTRRILHHSPRVRETLGKFRERIIAKHAARIESLVLESFQYLLRKSSLVAAVQIDPAGMRLKLIGPDGKPIPFVRLSAGERQLLATAILWGLAKASGRPVPVIIDTPLARLDSRHRHHLVERYFPRASHQVILLSTDEEISSHSLELLQPFVSRAYRLDYDDPTKRTVVHTEQYFTT